MKRVSHSRAIGALLRLLRGTESIEDLILKGCKEIETRFSFGSCLRNGVPRAQAFAREGSTASLSTSALGLLCILVAATLVSCSGRRQSEPSLRIGYLPNITHSQALVGLAKGEFQKALGSVILVPKLFPSGPSAIEALLAGDIDLTYVGPAPAINAYVRTEGRALRVIAGAASGGAVFVRRAGVSLDRKEDFPGKRFASPQIGNTQDLSLRAYLAEMGCFPKEKGGTVEVLPLANADILTLFLRKELDAAWVAEPWGALLVHRGGGVIQVDERDLWPERRFSTALVVASTKALAERPEWVRKFLAAHVALTRWILHNREETLKLVNQEIAKINRQPLAEKVLTEASSRFEATFDPLPDSLDVFFQRARAVGYLRKGTLEGMVDLRLLKEVQAGVSREAPNRATRPGVTR